MPDSAPIANARARLMPPPLCSGSEMIAPSGKFWIAIPSESANAPAAESDAPPMRSPAYITPTAMPSGMLCSVTASTIIAERPSEQRGPSGSSQSTCRCGMILSSSSRNAMPSRKPPAAGANAQRPIASH